ncbi:hypothetical protein KLER11_gp14 [Pararheinheimera phage vB_PsoM_KLER1-1]|nr:hypothetical protein KLER11_gp14 [Pararheinheimera phage vB_PsoM_KLER1-1]
MILDMSDALRALIEECTSGLSMENSGGGTSAPAVYDAFVPKKARGKPDPVLPFVVVRPSNGSDDPPEGNAYQSTVEAMLLIAVHTQDDVGYRDVLNIIEKIRQRVLTNPIFGKRFLVARPVTWEISEDESWPNWYGVMTLQVTVPQPIELLNAEEAGTVYGQAYPPGG